VGYVPEKNGTLSTVSNTQGRLIAYGTGNVAKQILPSFMKCNITPSLVWDQKAREGERFLGIPCAVPEFTSLTKNDIILILLNGNQDVEEELKKYNVEIYHYIEVLDALTIKHLPELAEVKYD